MPPPVKARKEEKKKVNSARDRAMAHESGFGKSLSLPDGINFFAVKKPGTYRFDVLPYTAGEGNKHAQPGDLHFERTYFVHRNIGADQDMVPCPKRNFNKPCPVCEFKAKLQANPDSSEEDDKLAKDLTPKERQLWWVWDHAEKDKGPKLFDISYHNFGKQLDSMVKAGDDGEYDYFADPEEGFTLKVTFDEESFGSGTFLKAGAIEMKARKEPIDPDVLEQCGCLDEFVRDISYDELKKMFLQEEEPAETEEEETPPPKPKAGANGKPGKKTPPPVDEDEPEPEEETPAEEEDEPAEETTAEEVGLAVDDVVEHPKLGRCTVIHVSGDGTSLRLQDEEGAVHRAVDPAKCTKVEEEAAETEEEETTAEVEEEVELEDEPEEDPPLEEEEVEEEELAPKPPAKKPAAAAAKPASKPAAKPAAPAAKRPAAAPAKPAGKPAGKK